ncbi:MAG TPA: sn-glycerol-3-phosphate ABC transporter ATP-binding protein UgpC [Polyangiaceae bacterium]|nr:sn-glycerol-3-phosphate ABC transporter ATP-binding protein UgpC [Polyangiaceae bacterium]
MAGVVLEDVVKVYEGGLKVVDRFNLDIADREFVVLVGPSGCGKSTTLRMIAGLEEVSSGTISIGGRVVNEVAPKDRDIAMVFQSYALYPHMSVYDNMAFALKLRNTPKASIDEKVQRAAKVLMITHLLERKPKALSGGQRQRVALGRAIVRDPKCFLFDEPLSNLDAKLRVEMRAEIKQITMSLNATTVYVTHDQEEAMTLGDRVVVMKDGITQQIGSALSIYNHPLNRFVASFLGSPPMNFFTGRLVEAAGRLWFDEGSGKLPIADWARLELRPRVGQEVVLGVRPEAMSDKAHARFQTEDNQLPMNVTLVQPLGHKMDVYLSTARHPRAVAQIDSYAEVQRGETLPVFFDMSRVHFFEPGENGAKLVHNTSIKS